MLVLDAPVPNGSDVAAADQSSRLRVDPFSRRRFLKAALAAAALPVLPGAGRAAASPGKRLVAGTRIIEVNGRPAKVFGLTGPNGRPGMRVGAGEPFSVQLVNQSGVDTIVHWHGQLPPWKQDGFPWPETPPILNGAAQAYDYSPIPGTYWMHSHQGLQEQSLMTAPLIVEDAAEARADRQEVVLMLHDFTFRTPEEVLSELTKGSGAHSQMMAPTVGEGADETGNRKPAMPGMAMPGITMSDQAGMQSDMHRDLNDVRYDAFLANDRTLADPEVVYVERAGRVRLRIINGASSSQFWVDLGELIGHVVATDGHAVEPVAGSRFPLAMAQRLDILVDLPGTGSFPVLARVEGDGRQTGIILATTGASIARIPESAPALGPVGNSLENRLAALEPLSPRRADIVQTMVLGGGMTPYAWSINGEYWPDVKPLMLTKGQRVEIDFVNRTMMSHPMHLHGHAFQVIEIDGRPLRGALRDTVLVGPMGRIRVAFDADNPGRWALHCHNLYHVATGMMTELRYRGISV
jgi:FtsP/CotA-like multicopper oxidase with cupredoxin domain